MNKRATTLICAFFLLASSQLACSFSDLLGDLGKGIKEPAPQEHILPENDLSLNGEDQGSSGSDESSQASLHPETDPSSCSDNFSGSSNIPDGSEYQAGETVEALLTLTNTGTCVWSTAYSLVMVGGDLMPTSEDLPIIAEVAVGESISMGVEFSAPYQDGIYQSVWKMSPGQGGTFGMENPHGAPLRIKVRILSSGSPQPTPTPIPQASGNQFTMLEDECFDFNSGSVVDCSDSSVDFMYNSSHPLPGQLFKYNDTSFGDHHPGEPDLNTCQNDAYAPLPHSVSENEYLCFKIETVASSSFGWIRVTHFNEEGLSFDFVLLGSAAPLVTLVPNTNLFVESQGQQITLLEGECYDVWNGEENSSCSGIFAGFLFEEVTKKNMQVSQISVNEMYFSAARESAPTKSECLNASYSTTPIWPIQSTSYYCFQFVPGSSAYYGWLRPTSFNLGGLTFDYLTWEISQ